MKNTEGSVKIQVKYPFSKILVKRNTYRDSIELLKITDEVKKIPGVIQALIGMATDTNVELLKLLGFEIDVSVTPNDLIIAIGTSSEESLQNALNKVNELLESGLVSSKSRYYDIDSALRENPDINIALISIPGQYVKDIALPLIERGINLHIFSDNVPIQDEIEIKKKAAERDVLVLGPGAGTVIIKGIGLGFSNKVLTGDIGIVAASGTGLQEVSSSLSNIGIGISYGLGVGGNDVKDAVGGIMTIKSLDILQNDEDTKIISIISKVPDKNTEGHIIDYVIKHITKPIVINFLGGTVQNLQGKNNIIFTKTLHQTIIHIAKLKSEEYYLKAIKEYVIEFDDLLKLASELKSQLSPGQRFIRGLFTGGTFTHESQIILKELVNDLYSNSPVEGVNSLKNPFESMYNTIVDMGEEVFTRGRPHPMIDPTLRINRILNEMKDLNMAVLLLDFVLGYGSHNDPVGAHIDVLKQAMDYFEDKGRKLIMIAHVCGTKEDPQDLQSQINKLKSIGAIVMPTNAQAAFLAGAIISTLSREKLKYVYDDLLG